MKAIIVGGAGFIGSNMADFLLEQGWHVHVVDNFSSGKQQFIEHNFSNENFSWEECDTKDLEGLKKAFSGYDIVFHFAANADVKGGADNPTLDVEENVVTISNVLEACRANNIKKIMFASTGSIYGETKIFPTPEDAPFPLQTSMYGAAKVYGEGLIASYCEAYDMQAWIYRFVSILGERYTHGVIFSFFKQLSNDKTKLEFLSDGSPSKSYLYVGDCVKGIWTGIQKAQEKVNIFNLGTDEEIDVKTIGDIVTRELDVSPTYHFGEDEHGWIGDNPRIRLDISKLQALGWKPELSIKEAIIKTVTYLKENPWTIDEKYFRDK